jgi:hypothetical protein
MLGGMGDLERFMPLFSFSYMPETVFLCFGMMLARKQWYAKVQPVIKIIFHQPNISR